MSATSNTAQNTNPHRLLPCKTPEVPIPMTSPVIMGCNYLHRQNKRNTTKRNVEQMERVKRCLEYKNPIFRVYIIHLGNTKV